MAERLLGKVAVVTGAASGMGKAIAIDFVKEGAKIVATDMNEDGLKELEKEVAELGLSDQLRIQKCNVTSTEDCEAAVRTCVEAFGTMNVLSHNAGIADNFAPTARVTDELWDRQISVNLTGSMKIARAALQYFVPNEIKASMVMITSNAAIESATGGAAYTASKAGANALMKSIAYEYGRKGIRCNAILPGPIMTNIAKSMGQRDDEGVELHHKTGYNAHCGEWMLPMRLGKPEDISPLAVYLASDESRFVQSASIVIDGGVCLG